LTGAKTSPNALFIHHGFGNVSKIGLTESFVLWLTLSEDQSKQIIAFKSLEDKKYSYGTKSLRENPFA